MPKVYTSATLWPAIRLQMQRCIRELIREHCAVPLDLARRSGHQIGYAQRLELWLSFRIAFPMIVMDHESFLDELTYALGRPVIRREHCQV